MTYELPSRNTFVGELRYRCFVFVNYSPWTVVDDALQENAQDVAFGHSAAAAAAAAAAGATGGRERYSSETCSLDFVFKPPRVRYVNSLSLSLCLPSTVCPQLFALNCLPSTNSTS